MTLDLPCRVEFVHWVISNSSIDLIFTTYPFSNMLDSMRTLSSSNSERWRHRRSARSRKHGELHVFVCRRCLVRCARYTRSILIRFLTCTNSPYLKLYCINVSGSSGLEHGVIKVKSVGKLLNLNVSYSTVPKLYSLVLEVVEDYETHPSDEVCWSTLTSDGREFKFKFKFQIFANLNLWVSTRLLKVSNWLPHHFEHVPCLF